MGGALGRPSNRSAVIVRTHLPPGLERLRRRFVPDSVDGVPAHLTLLYPFIAPERLDGAVRSDLARVATGHRPFDYELAGAATWPDTVYVRVEPAEPFTQLQADLAAAFPAFPIYGRETDFRFEPHVTVAEGASVDLPEATLDPAWQALPAGARATAIEVIVRPSGGRWTTRWRLALGGSAATIAP